MVLYYVTRITKGRHNNNNESMCDNVSAVMSNMIIDGKLIMMSEQRRALASYKHIALESSSASVTNIHVCIP
jgi:hypothetical protein